VSAADALKAELRVIRGQGFAISREEFTPGSISVAAPIRNYSGAVIASLGVHASTSTMTKDRIPHAIAAAQEIAARLSRELGYDITQATRGVSSSLSAARLKAKPTVDRKLKSPALAKAKLARSAKELRAR
jgi:transcriptional regulator of acetoin/glycerol metabolism